MASPLLLASTTMLTITGKKITDAFNLIRSSDKYGIGSGSYVDECYTDRELFEEITQFFRHHKTASSQDCYSYIADLCIANDYPEIIYS